MKETYQTIWNRVTPPKELIEKTELRMEHTGFSKKRSVARRIAAVCAALLLIVGVTGYWGISSTDHPFVLSAYAEGGDLIPVTAGKELLLKATPEHGVQLGYTGNATVEGELFYALSFHCTGENIKSLTYSTEAGDFYQKFILNKKQYVDDDYRNSLGITMSSIADNAETGEGYACLGKSMTIPYQEQDNGHYLFCFYISGDPSFDLKKYDESKLSAEIQITATFEDDTTSSKTVVLTTDGKSFYAIEK